MNICYPANCRFPSERAHVVQIVEMCNALAENGHTVTLFVTDRATHISLDSETYYGKKFLFSVVRVPVPDLIARVDSVPRFLQPILFLIQQFIFAWRVRRVARTEKFDVIYGREEVVLFLLSLFPHAPIIWESHEAKFSLVAKLLIKKVKTIVAISEGIRDVYVTKGVPTEKICVEHDAVDARFFEKHIPHHDAQKTLGVSPDKPAVLYIGGLDTWKGVGTLFEAAKDQDVFAVYIVGGKPDELKTFRVQYPHVTFLGSRPYRELAHHQQAADILVIPNTAKNDLSAQYTSPLKLFAYMTARKPIVASRIPSLTNVLSEDEAFFCTPDDPTALRDTLMEVLHNPEEARRRAEKAFARSHYFTWQKRAARIFEAYLK